MGTKTLVGTPDPPEPQPGAQWPWATVSANGAGAYLVYTVTSSAPVAYSSNGTYTA